MTPYEAWYKRKPNLSKLRTFGKKIYVVIPKPIREGKLENVGKLVYFAGNSDTQKGERFYDPSTGKVITSCDASPAHHVYEPHLPSLNIQNDTEFFPQPASQPNDNLNLVKTSNWIFNSIKGQPRINKTTQCSCLHPHLLLTNRSRLLFFHLQQRKRDWCALAQKRKKN